MRSGKLLALALAAAAPAAALATDAPHDASNLDQGGNGIDCKSCHTAHNAAGASLTTTAGNANLCDSCHSLQTRYGFPWNASEQSVPGTSGTSHRWDAAAVNDALGTVAPDRSSSDPGEAAMGQRLVGGKLQCSTCHDQHNGANAFKGSLKISVTLGVALTRLNTTGQGTGTVALTSVPAGATAAGYQLRIDPANAARFQLSHDRGNSWFGYNAALSPQWGPASDTANYGSGKPFTSGTGVTLDDGLTVVTFTGTFRTTDRFQDFYVSYPFLRMANDGSQMCVVCHPDRNQSHARATGADAGYVPDGTREFSHPVGESLGMNGGGYDRGSATSSTILDANGAAQSAGDGISSNDLLLGANNTVQCLSCHRPHNADSNSLTEQP